MYSMYDIVVFLYIRTMYVKMQMVSHLYMDHGVLVEKNIVLLPSLCML